MLTTHRLVLVNKQKSEVMHIGNAEVLAQSDNTDITTSWISTLSKLRDPTMTGQSVLKFISLKKAMKSSGCFGEFCTELTENYITASQNIESIPVIFSLGEKRIRELPLREPKTIKQVEKALDNLHEKVRSIVDSVHYNLRQVSSERKPGFVIDGLVIIPKNDRELERQIYQELCQVINDNPSLLFNVRIIAKKDRKINQIVPKRYARYSTWSSYIC